MALLQVAAQGRPGARYGLVVDPGPARRPARALGGRHGRPHQRRRGRRPPGHTAHGRRHRLRPDAGPVPDPRCGQRGPRRPHRGLALRPADRRLPGAPGDRAPRGGRPGRRPAGGPGLRPGHDGAAAAHLDGLHRRRAGPDAGRAGVGGRPLRLRLVGAAGAGRRLAGDSLAAAGERGLEGPQHRRGAPGPAGRRLRLPPRRRRPGGQGAAPLRPAGLDAGPVRRPPDEAARAAVRGHPDAGALGAQQPGRGRRRQPAGVLAAGRRRVGRVDRPRPAGHVRAGRHRGVGHRLRRAELGAGRGRRSRGRRVAPEAGHGSRRRADRRGPGGPGRGARPAAAGRDLRLPRDRSAGPGRTGPRRARRVVAGHRGPERGGQDHPGQAPLPPLRPAVRHHPGRRCRPPGPGSRRLAHPDHRRLPGLHPLRAPAAGQRGALGGVRRVDHRRPGRSGGRRPGRARHPAGQGLRGRHRPLGRPVAAGRPGPGTVRRPRGGRPGPARRADRAVGRPG